MQFRSDRYRAPRTDRRAFTLIELLLTVVIMLLLLGAAVFNFSSLQRNVALDEGCVQLEALLRFARSHAIGTGRTVQLVFPEIGAVVPPGTPSLVQLLTEADPVGNPGLYSVVHEGTMYAQEITSRLKILRVRDITTDVQAPVAATSKPLSSRSSSVTKPTEVGKTEPPGTEVSDGSTIPERIDQSVYFFADGTSDSVEIVVASHDRDDLRRWAIELVGITGTPRRRTLRVNEESADGTAAAANSVRGPDTEQRP